MLEDDGHGAPGSSMAEADFLDYFSQPGPKDAENWQTFVNLFYKHLRRGTLSIRFKSMLKKCALEEHTPPKFLSTLMECLLTGCTDGMDLNTVLALEAMCQKVSEKPNPELALKRFALRAVGNLKVILPDTMLLLAVIAGSLEMLFVKCIEVVGWKQGVQLLQRLMELRQQTGDYNGCDLPLEDLCDLVKGHDDLPCFLDIYNGLDQVTLEQILPAHDLLIKFKYPRDCLVPFVRLMKRALSCNFPPFTFPIVNICSNAERTLSSLHGIVDVKNRTELFFGVIISITELCILPAREIEKLINTTNKNLDVIDIDPDGLEAISVIVCRSSHCHRETAKRMWLTACQAVLGNRLLIERYLKLLDSSSQPWYLLHPLLLSLSDPKLQYFQLYGRPALLALSKVILESEIAGTQTIERGMAESICMHTSALINVLGAGKPQHERYARENHQVVALSMALILRFQVKMKWKHIDRIVSEYSPTLPLYHDPPSRFSYLILTEMYKAWIDGDDALFLPELRRRDPDALLVMHMLMLFKFSPQDTPQVASQLAKELKSLPLPRQQAALHTIKNGLVSLIEDLRYQADALVLTRKLVYTLRSVSWLCDSEVARCLLQSPLVHTNIYLLADMADVYGARDEQSFVDNFDAALFAIVRERCVPKYPLFQLSPNGAIWTLRRLTAVVLSECLPCRLDESNSFRLIIDEDMNLDCLVRGLMKSCSFEAFKIYAEELFQCYVEGCNAHLLAMCAYVTIFSLEFRTPPISILGKLVQTIKTGDPAGAPTTYERLLEVCADLQRHGSPLLSSLLEMCADQGDFGGALELANASISSAWQERWHRLHGENPNVLFFGHPLEDIFLQ